MSSKLNNELQELVAENVISAEVSTRISAYLAAKEQARPNRLFAIFGVLGSLLTGLGIILILAHNWDDFSVTTKTIWAFMPLLIGQLFAGYALFSKKNETWREASATFLFLSIGASIALISQIYNIPGSMPSFLLTWIVLAAPILYLLRSYAATLLFLVFSTAYACNLGYFNDESPWLYVAMLLWIMPFYYRLLNSKTTENRTGILNWLLPLSMVICLGAFVSGQDTIGFLMYIVLFGLFYNIGKLPFFSKQRLRSNGYVLIGSLGTVFVLMIISFRWFWEESFTSVLNVQDTVITIFFGMAAIGVLIYLFLKKQMKPFNLFQYAFLLVSGIFAIRLQQPEISMILVNLLVFALGVFAIRIGAKRNTYSILNYGLLIISVLIICRFFDTEIPFVIRGLLFVAIGFGFFGTNYFMYKKQRKIETHE